MNLESCAIFAKNRPKQAKKRQKRNGDNLAGDLVLSLFPGLGVLGKAFEEAGWCVVRGPDVIWGGDVRDFNPPPGGSVRTQGFPGTEAS